MKYAKRANFRKVAVLTYCALRKFALDKVIRQIIAFLFGVIVKGIVFTIPHQMYRRKTYDCKRYAYYRDN